MRAYKWWGASSGVAIVLGDTLHAADGDWTRIAGAVLLGAAMYCASEAGRAGANEDRLAAAKRVATFLRGGPR